MAGGESADGGRDHQESGSNRASGVTHFPPPSNGRPLNRPSEILAQSSFNFATYQPFSSQARVATCPRHLLNRLTSNPELCVSPDQLTLPPLRRSETSQQAPTSPRRRGHHQGSNTTETSHNLIDDDAYLSMIATNEWSSPSTYPSFTQYATTSSPVTARLPALDRHNFTFGHSLSTRSLGVSSQQPSSPSRRASAHTPQLSEEIPRRGLEQVDDPMPTTRARDAAVTQGAQPLSGRKRRRASGSPNGLPNLRSTAQRNFKSPTNDNDDEDLFGSEASQFSLHDGLEPTDSGTIDLTEANDVPEDLQTPVVDNRVKLLGFQCVVCMDSVTTLTVTHCGKQGQPSRLR